MKPKDTKIYPRFQVAPGSRGPPGLHFDSPGTMPRLFFCDQLLPVKLGTNESEIPIPVSLLLICDVKDTPSLRAVVCGRR